VANLLQPACRLYCEPARSAEDLDEALGAFPEDGDALWPALARHIARRSNDKDRALLEGLAQDPKRREPPLRWGLQYIVRGDVMLDDGTVVTLNELADEAGMPPLPWIEDMPEHLEIDWDESE